MTSEADKRCDFILELMAHMKLLVARCAAAHWKKETARSYDWILSDTLKGDLQLKFAPAKPVPAQRGRVARRESAARCARARARADGVSSGPSLAFSDNEAAKPRLQMREAPCSGGVPAEMLAS